MLFGWIKNGVGYPFFFYSQLPPFFIWLVYLFYHVFGSFIETLRVLPVFLSVLILGAAWMAVREYGSKLFSFIYLSLIGLGFWPLFYGKLSHQGLLMILWEYLTLWALGLYLKDGSHRTKWLVLLGLLVGSGCYTYFAWFLIAGIISAAVFWKEGIVGGKRGFVLPWLFLLPILLSLIPFLIAVTLHGYGSYFNFLWSFKSNNNWALQVQNTFSCLASFLWSNGFNEFYYGPVWGGFFNPVSGSALLIGIIELYKRRSNKAVQFIFGSGLLLLIPAFLTNSLTDMREISIQPLLTLFVVLGTITLIKGQSHKKQICILTIFLTTTSGLDFIHLEKFENYINHYWKAQKTSESFRAFQELDRYQKLNGPGFVLTSFSNDFYTYDQSLLIGTYPFNVAQNHAFSPEDAHWLSVVTNVHFKPFLSKRFPKGQWIWLSQGMDPSSNTYSGGLMLGIIPLDSQNRGELADWIKSNALFQKMSDHVMGLPIDMARKENLKTLAMVYPQLSKDRFIQSCYWEFVYFSFNWENLYGDRNTAIYYPMAFSAIQMAIQKGYPTAYFYNELGSFYAMQKNYPAARKAFNNAIHSSINLTPAEENLKALEALEKKSK